MTLVVFGMYHSSRLWPERDGSCGAADVVPYVVAIGHRAVCPSERCAACTSAGQAEARDPLVAGGPPVAEPARPELMLHGKASAVNGIN
jgi:hypothetical protein